MQITAKILYDKVRDMAAGLYVWTNPDEQSVLDILRYLKGAPFKVYSSTELHCTVLHCNDPLPHTIQVPGDRPFEAHITSIDTWQDHKDRTIVVLTLDCPELMQVNQALQAQGLTHSYPDFTPHITVAKAIELDASTRLWLDITNARLRINPGRIALGPQLTASSIG